MKLHGIPAYAGLLLLAGCAGATMVGNPADNGKDGNRSSVQPLDKNGNPTNGTDASGKNGQGTVNGADSTRAAGPGGSGGAGGANSGGAGGANGQAGGPGTADATIGAPLGSTQGMALTNCIAPNVRSVFLPDRGGGHNYFSLLTPGDMVDATHQTFTAKDVLQTDPGTFHPHHRLFDVTFVADISAKVPPAEAAAAAAAQPALQQQAVTAQQQAVDQAKQDQANQVFLTDDVIPGTVQHTALALAETTNGNCPLSLTGTTETHDLGGCFTDDNVVLMADGTEKQVAALVPGDLVRDAVTGQPARIFKHVTSLAAGEPVVTVGFGAHLTHVTATHPILTTAGMKAAVDVKVGDYVYDAQGKPARVDTAAVAQPTGVYPIHNFLFASANGKLSAHYMTVNGLSAGDLLLEGELGKTHAPLWSFAEVLRRLKLH